MKKFRPFVGEVRHIKKFLWFPKNNDGVTRWLETAEWDEIYSYYLSDGGNEYFWWSFCGWLDVEEEQIPAYKDDK